MDAKQSDKQDNAVYKMMGFVIFTIVGLPLGYGLTRGPGIGGTLALILALFVFDAGWDLAVLAMRSDRLKVAAPLLIVAKALARTTPVAVTLLFLTFEQRARAMAVVFFVSWIVEEILIARRKA